MLEDRFYQICRQNYSIKILTHATYEAKQTLAAKGISPAIFLSPFYMRKGDYSMEVAYGQKDKNYKPLPQICPIDLDQYDNKQRDDTMNRIIRQTIIQSQSKTPKNITSQTFKSRQNIENYLNNLNFHWFENSLRKFYHGLSLDKSIFDKSTLQQPKGIAYIIEVNDKSLKENFEKIKREVDTLLKKMYYLNPNHTKAIPVLAIVFYDPNKKYALKDMKVYADSLKNDYGVETVLTAKLQVNGPSPVDSTIWSNYTRPIFTFNYNLTSETSIKLLNQEGTKSLYDIVNIHKERIKKMFQYRLQVLFKKYDDHYSVGNKLLGFLKGNSTPKSDFLVTEEAQAREIADLMFLLEDYKKAHDIYRNILKDFQKRNPAIQMELRYALSLCYEMGKFVNQKVSSTTPKNFLEKEVQQFVDYEKQGRKQLTKFLILFLYQLHTFKIFDPNLIKQVYLPMIKRSMSMPEQTAKKGEQPSHSKFPFLMPTLLYEQYSNLNLLYQYIDYRRYCYDTVRVSMKFSEYKIYNHALRCLLLVEKVYVETFASAEKYVAVHLSSNYFQSRNFTESLNSMKKAWRILAENTTFHDYNYNTELAEFKKMTANHGKIITLLEQLSPETLRAPDDKNLVIPYVVQTDIRLSGEEEIQQTDRTGVTWTQISEYLNQNSELYSQGYNKAAMQKIFKLFDCTFSQEKQLLYRINCDNLNPAIISRNARISYIKQPIRLCFTFYNPFIQQIRISDFKVLIKDSYKNFDMVKNKQTQSLTIRPRKKIDVCFQIIPNETGLLQFQGVEWIFQKMATKYTFRDIRSVESKLKPFYSVIRIVDGKGKLKVHESPEQQLFEGQSLQNKIILQNCGQRPIESIYIAFGTPIFYGKKYEKLDIKLLPNQKRQITFNLNLPAVPDNIKSDWKVIDKKIFLYKTDGQFRVHRSSILTLINKVLFYKTVCQKLSTHLHLLTFTHDIQFEKEAQIESMIIRSGFEISKIDRTQFENTETYYFYLNKNIFAENEVYNFQRQLQQDNFNGLSINVDRLRKLDEQKSEDNIEMVFGWKTGNNRSGLIQIKPLHITPLKQQVLPFVFSTTMPFYIRHNFSNQPVLQKTFQIKLKNIFYPQQIGVKVQFKQQNLNGIYWQGITERSLKLKHNEEAVIDIGLIVSKSGVFDISECLWYNVEVNRKQISIKHSSHEKLYLHIIDESATQLELKRRTSENLSTQVLLSQPISLTDSSLMFTKKTSDKKQEISLMNPPENDLIGSPREPKSPKFSKVIESQLLSKKQEKNPADQSDNLIDLL